ncbi:MAG: Lactoylglutathione lyase and related lyases, partial [uncultured Rubellimicrobium sp.]
DPPPPPARAARDPDHPGRPRLGAFPSLLPRPGLASRTGTGRRVLLPDPWCRPRAVREGRLGRRHGPAGGRTGHGRDHARPELRDGGGRGRGLPPGGAGRGQRAQGPASHVLGRLFGLLRRSGRACLGSGDEPVLAARAGRQPDPAKGL